jgi:hypothetical protein
VATSLAGALLAIGLPGLAAADTVTNTAPANGATTSLGSPASVNFQLAASDDAGENGNSNKCNVRGNAGHATLGFTITGGPQGSSVTVTPSTHQFTDCETAKAVQFAPSAVGTYTVQPTVTGPGVLTTPSSFVLRVLAATPVAAPTSLTLGAATAAYDAASVDLVATLTSGVTGVANKLVSFSVAGTSVGSATTNASGVATLAYALNKTRPAGTYATAATFTADSAYQASNAAQPAGLTVSKAGQTVTFAQPANVTFGVSPLTLSPTASSGLTVALTSSPAGVCTVAGTVVTVVGTGTCSLTAAQAGGDNWNAATSVTRSFVVAKASQTVTLALSRYSAAYRDGDTTTVTRSATSGLAVTLGTSGPCSLDGTSLTTTGAGTCVVTGNQAGNANYLAAPAATQTLTIGKATQSITFAPLGGKTFGDAAFSISATASSGLPVSFTAAQSSVCTYADGTITITGAGQCTVTASQAGDTDYDSAGDVTHAFTVSQSAQTIDFAALSPRIFGEADFPVSATAPGGSVTFSATGDCEVADAVVRLTGAGHCTITAAQGGDGDYQAAPSVSRTFTIGQSAQTITLPMLVDRTYAGTTAIITGTSSTSGLTVALAAGPSRVCSALGGTVTVHGAGECTVTATQDGNDDYVAAEEVTQTFTVAKAAQTISFDALQDVAFGVQPIVLSATSGSGGVVAFRSTTESVCAIVAGPKVAVRQSGDCTIEADQGGDDDFEAAPTVARTFSVDKATQSITLGIGSETATFGDKSRTVDAVATSGLDVLTEADGPCTLRGDVLSLDHVGLCIVTATQGGDARYEAAEPASATVDIAKANQLITFQPLADMTVGDAGQPLVATSDSGLAVSFTASPDDVCSVTNGLVEVVNAGECTVTAAQGGDEDRNSAPDVSHTLSVVKATQSITFAALEDKTYLDDAFELAATATSGSDVAFAADGDCAVLGTTVTLTGAGVCTITATQPGGRNFQAAAPVERTFAIAQAAQEISFDELDDKIFGDEDFDVSATSDRRLTVSFASTTTSVCTVTGRTVAILTAGPCSIKATQAGTKDFEAAPPVVRSFMVARKAQLITFTDPGSKTFGAESFSLIATSDSGLDVTVSAGPADVCTVASKLVTITGAGECTLVASQGGDGNHLEAPSLTHDVRVDKSEQTVTMGVTTEAATFGDGPATITASATSGLPVSLSATGPCSLGDTTPTATGGTTPLTFTGAGDCTVHGNQIGDRNYDQAEQAEAVVAIAKSGQTITFASPGNRTFGDAPIALTGTSSSRQPVTYTAAPLSVCSIVTSGPASSLKVNGAGDCTVTARQAGNDDYNAAPDVARPITVAKASQTVTFAELAGKTFGDAPFDLGATASSLEAVAFTASGPCTVLGKTVRLTGAGECTVTAAQAGNSDYEPTTSLSQTFTIVKAAQTIAFAAIAGKTYGDDVFPVSPTSSAGLAVTVSSSTTGVCTVGNTGIAIKGAGTCTLSASQAGNGNYESGTAVERSFAVAKAALTVTAPSDSRLLGAANPAPLTPTYGNFAYSDTVASLNTPASCSTAATTSSPVGTYEISCSGVQSENYVVTYVKGTLTVLYDYSGLLQPINVDRSSAFKSGSTIPVKWQVLNSAKAVQDAGTLRTTIRVVKLGAATAAGTNETAVTAPGDSAASFRWDNSAKQYIFNLSTRTWAMGDGTYRADVVDATGTVLTSGQFQVRA